MKSGHLTEGAEQQKRRSLEKMKKKLFQESSECWICGEEFEFSELKVRDHCHFTGKFRGATHSKCNLQFTKPNFTPVIFHNLSGYDSHIFISQLGKSNGKVKAIPKT